MSSCCRFYLHKGNTTENYGVPVSPPAPPAVARVLVSRIWRGPWEALASSSRTVLVLCLGMQADAASFCSLVPANITLKFI